MKIEMGESLIYSYLRHVKKCLFTQTNWKASSSWDYSPTTYSEVNAIFDKILANPEFASIFPSSFDQTLKQAEIDVLGIDGANNIYAVDIAYHEAGLQYGTEKNETRDRVAKKLLRTMLLLKLYFPTTTHRIIFCSPKVTPATHDRINAAMKLIRDGYEENSVVFEYFANDDFYDRIMKPTLEGIKSEPDSSELFSRSIKLLELFK